MFCGPFELESVKFTEHYGYVEEPHQKLLFITDLQSF